MPTTLFSIPPEEEPEAGAPDRVEHGCDYMLLPDGKVEFHYNFLNYVWRIGDEELTGRAYLDEVSTVSVDASFKRLQNDPVLQAIVRFLQRRFMRIKSFHRDDVDDSSADTGYNIAFQHERFKEPE